MPADIDTTMAGLVAAFVTAFGGLAALVGWLIRHLFQATLPEQQKTFAAALDKVVEHHRGERELDREERARQHAEMMVLLGRIHDGARESVHATRNLDAALRSRSRLADALQSADLPAWTKSLDGTLWSWNQAAERALGWRQGEIVGHSIYERLVPPERREEEQRVLQRIAAGDHLEEYLTERVTRDGRRVGLAVVTSPVRDQAGKVIGASTIAREV